MELQTIEKDKTLETKGNGEVGTVVVEESRTYQLVKTGALVCVWVCFVSAFFYDMFLAAAVFCKVTYMLSGHGELDFRSDQP